MANNARDASTLRLDRRGWSSAESRSVRRTVAERTPCLQISLAETTMLSVTSLLSPGLRATLHQYRLLYRYLGLSRPRVAKAAVSSFQRPNILVFLHPVNWLPTR